MRSYKEFLRHIIDEVYFIEKECFNLSYRNFIADELIKRAVVRSLEIIGEAVKKYLWKS